MEGHTLLVDDGPLPFDVYWSTTSRAAAAHKKSRATDVRISIVPGVGSSTVPKGYMVDVITHTYGAQAFSIIPPTFRLPQGAAALRAYVDSQVRCRSRPAAAGEAPAGTPTEQCACPSAPAPRAQEGAGADWVLKQLRHRGEGVHFIKGREVLQHARLSAEADKPYVAAQRLIDPQFSVLHGRVSKLRRAAAVQS